MKMFLYQIITATSDVLLYDFLKCKHQCINDFHKSFCGLCTASMIRNTGILTIRIKIVKCTWNANNVMIACIELRSVCVYCQWVFPVQELVVAVYHGNGTIVKNLIIVTNTVVQYRLWFINEEVCSVPRSYWEDGAIHCLLWKPTLVTFVSYR